MTPSIMESRYIELFRTTLRSAKSVIYDVSQGGIRCIIISTSCQARSSLSARSNRTVSISIWRKCILGVPILFPDVSLLSPTIDMVKRSKITVYYYKWHATDFYLTIIDATGGLHKDGKVCTFETLYDTLLLLQILIDSEMFQS